MSLQENTLQAVDPISLEGCIPRGYSAAVRTIGKNIARIRKDRGLNQTQLAEQVGMKPAAMWKIEHAHGLPELDTLFKVAKALTCSVDELIEGVDPDYDAIRGRPDPIVLMKPSKTSLHGEFAEEFSRLWGRLPTAFSVGGFLSRSANVAVVSSRQDNIRQWQRDHASSAICAAPDPFG